MPKYRVGICIECFVYVDIEAESKEEAVKKAEEFEYADDKEFVYKHVGHSVFDVDKLED